MQLVGYKTSTVKVSIVYLCNINVQKKKMEPRAITKMLVVLRQFRYVSRKIVSSFQDSLKTVFCSFFS